MMRALLLSMLLVPIVSQAADLALVVGGWSHHFVPEAERHTLNQSQDTLGFEFTTRRWDVQVSHMRDSFDCSSNDVAAAKRWSMADENYITVGLMLGVLVAHRCTRGVVTNSSIELVPIGTSNEYIWPNQLDGLYADCPDPGRQPVCTIVQPQTVVTRTQAPPRWVIGLIPGIYCNVGGNIRAELTLMRSPWTGHHFVAYLQFSVKVFSF